MINEYKDLKIGDRIEIISNVSKYKGYKGTVTRFPKAGRVGIFIDNTIYQPNSYRKSYGNDIVYFYGSIRKIGENEMAKLTDYNLVAAVTHTYGYDTKKTYYFALYDETVKAGDYAVVGSMSNPQIVKIENVLSKEDGDKEFGTISKPILGKLDMTSYLANEEKKEAMMKLRKEMDAKRKEIEARKDDEYYASLDPEYGEMLKRMKELNS